MVVVDEEEEEEEEEGGGGGGGGGCCGGAARLGALAGSSAGRNAASGSKDAATDRASVAAKSAWTRPRRIALCAARVELFGEPGRALENREPREQITEKREKFP